MWQNDTRSTYRQQYGGRNLKKKKKLVYSPQAFIDNFLNSFFTAVGLR